MKKSWVFVYLVLITLFLGDTNRLRVILFNLKQVDALPASSELKNYSLKFTQTNQTTIDFFLNFQEEIGGAPDDLALLRKYGDAIYRLKETDMDIPQSKHPEDPLESVHLAKKNPLCGVTSMTMVHLLRSSGYPSFHVIWYNPAFLGFKYSFCENCNPFWWGERAHAGLEVYLHSFKKWVYYDTNYNGYALDKDNIPLSCGEIQKAIEVGWPMSYVGNPILNIDSRILRSSLKYFPNRVHFFRNDDDYYNEKSRFGPLNSIHFLIRRLPIKVQNIFDFLIGSRRQGIIVQDAMPNLGMSSMQLRWLLLFLLVLPIGFLIYHYNKILYIRVMFLYFETPETIIN